MNYINEAIAFLEESRNIYEYNARCQVVQVNLLKKFPIESGDTVPIRNGFEMFQNPNSYINSSKNIGEYFYRLGRVKKHNDEFGGVVGTVPKAVGIMSYIQLNARKPQTKTTLTGWKEHLHSCPVCGPAIPDMQK